MTPRIAFVGEAWGRQEELLGRPFVGDAGQLFDDLCRSTGIVRSECLVTNVINARPPGTKNDFLEFCVKVGFVKDNFADAVEYIRKMRRFPAVKQGAFLRPELHFHIDRLKAELEDFKPTLAVAMGGVALWGLCGINGIMACRGSVRYSTLVPKLKVLPTLHPSFLLRGGEEFWPVAVMDFVKAKAESHFPEIHFPVREFNTNPSIETVEEFLTTMPNTPAAVDIESFKGQITVIGFARSKDFALSVPFVSFAKFGNSHWPDLPTEARAWRAVRGYLEGPKPKLFHNGVYDVQYLYRSMGIKVRNFREDTMHMHHALLSEMRKKLNILASIYTNEPDWKHMMPRFVDEGDEK